MKLLVRNVLLLMSALVLFIIILSALLWGWQKSAARHADYSSKFLLPSQSHLSRAERSLLRIQSRIYGEVLPSSQTQGIPLNFLILAEIDALEHHLLQVTHLAHTFNFQDAFGLPARALKQFQAARSRLMASDKEGLPEAEKALALLLPLQDTLEQLEQIYSHSERSWNNQHREAIPRTVAVIGIAIAVLVLTAVPLITRLVFGLRSNLRLELQSRQDLEEAKENLEFLAMYDSLTELGNRNLFRARLDQVLESAKRYQRVSALIYIDLDHFKRINDSLGHDAGDAVLRIVAARLMECVRSSDTVARLGGDEFTVVLTDMLSSGTITSIATKLLRQIEKPMAIAGTEVIVSASMGITVIPVDGDSPEALMKNADMALYKAKAQGRNNFQFFIEAMHRTMVRRMTMENDLRSTIRAQSFRIHYQPQLDLRTGYVTHIEALLRWPQPDGTVISPDEFIPVADESGLLSEIGGWVLMQACSDVARLRRDAASDLRVSVNLSAGQFRDPLLVRRIEQALSASALEPSVLEIEITETTLIEEIDAAAKVLDTLRTLGITIAIDDFGIGYSSLNYLKHLPIDSLKIDKSFVRDIEQDEADRRIVDAILAMANSLSLRVVAEGIETEWQHQYLTSNGCDMGQGFLFSKPVPVDVLFATRLNRPWPTAQAPNNRRLLQQI